MKTKHFLTQYLILLFLFFVIIIPSNAQKIQLPWDETAGIPYHISYDRNSGFDAFTFCENNQIAFLLKQDKKIRIFNIETGLKIQDITISIPAYDFAFYNNCFYLLSYNLIEKINVETEEHQIFELKNNDIYFEKINVSKGKIHLYTNNQTTWEIAENTGDPICISKNGLKIDDGIIATSTRLSNHSFAITINGVDKNFQTIKKLASAKITGFDGTNLYVDMQFIDHEIPLKVSREIWSMNVTKNGIDPKYKIISIPNCYYIHVTNEFYFSAFGSYYSLTDPEGTKIYSLDNTTIKTSDSYIGYHYNYHTLKSPNEENSPQGNAKATITRPEIIANAEPFATHQWTCNAINIKNYTCNGKTVLTPSWVTVGSRVALPYMWGGWSSLTQFDQGLLNGVSAGDCNTTGGGAGASCAVGVDCSGFISRAWNLTSKYGTSTLPNISTAYASYTELLPGDIVNYAGHHVRLVHTLNTNGTFLIIESSASATDWRVGYSTYSVANLQGVYIPRYYQNVVNTVIDTIPPQTNMSTSNWHTGNFDVAFTDSDNSAIQSLYWLPTGLINSNWSASKNKGFFYDDFNTGINPQWTMIEPSWNISSGTINQTNESLSQNNAFTTLTQDSTTSYLYHWKMKLSGSNTDRRAGIYIFADSATANQRNNAYMIYYRADLDLCQIYKSENNSITLMTEDPCVIDETNWFDCKVTYNPATGDIVAFLNDKPITSWTDSVPLKKGKYISLRTGLCNASYDEFKVYKSRSDLVHITTGATEMINCENPSPLIPACKIYSIAIDISNNFRFTSLETNIDLSAPLSIMNVNDIFPSDADTLIIGSPVNAFWNNSTDVNSGINGYRYALGTAPGTDDVVSWTWATDTSVLCTNILLQIGQMYYFSVLAENNAGLSSTTSISDGFLVLSSTKVLLIDNITKTKVYPLPAKENVNFFFPENNRYQLIITDMSGKIIQENEIEGSLFSFNIKNLNNGIFFFTLKNLSSGNLEKGKFSVVK